MTHKYEDEQIAMEGVYPHTKAPQRTDMEESKIEEMVEQLIEEADEMFWSDDDYTREDILKHILTKAHQAGRKEGIDEAVEVIKDYEKRMGENHNQLIGNSHEDSKMMLVFDMHSRLIATKHIIKALTSKK